MQGMTLKQAAKARFFDLLQQYKEALKDISTPEAKSRLVALSVAIHAAKGGVPKNLHSLVGRAFREANTKTDKTNVQE